MEEQEPFCSAGTLAAILHDCRFAGGMAVSGQSQGFGGHLFTRDTLRVLRDLIGLPGYGSFVEEMLATLPQWQGVKTEALTNEFPGAMPHQVFRQVVGGQWVPEHQLEETERWLYLWQVEPQHNAVDGWNFTVYNSSDGPPLYLITLAEYCRVAGKGVLGKQFRHWPTGAVRTVAEAARRCVDYIVQAIERRGDGLYGVPNTNPRQTSPSGVMRDGFDAYVRPDGSPIDYSHVAYIENQALAYEALLVAAELFAGDPQVPSWLDLARRLRERTIDIFWMDQAGFFAAALDSRGLVETQSSAVFEMLNGPFFAGLPDGVDFVKTLVRRLYSRDFMTAVGPRMISLQHAGLEGDYYAYQGSGVVWPVTTGIVTTGLCKWGLCWLSSDVGAYRMVAGLNHAGQASELIYVDRHSGEPLYKPEAAPKDADPEDITVLAAEPGQNNQAWTASAALRVLHMSHMRCSYLDPDEWRLELRKSGHRAVEENLAARHFPPTGELFIDTERGHDLKRQRARSMGMPVS